MDGPAQSAQLVLLHFAGTRVALSQRSVRSLEAAADVDFAADVPSGLGAIATASGRWPVYALNRELGAMADVPRERRICALLAAERGLFGVLCDEVQVLPRRGACAFPLPLAMRRSGTPAEGVLSFAGGVAVLSSARSLAATVRADAGLAALDAPESE